MARPGVSFFDVSKAATAIIDQGFTPTVDRVREILRTGSKSTIAPLLKQWKESNSHHKDNGELPQQLMDAVKSLYQTNRSIADERIQEITDNCNNKLNDAQNQLKATNQENTALKQELERLKEEIKQEQQKYKQLFGDWNSLSDTLKAKSQANTTLTEKSNQLLADKEELKLEVKTVRSHFEHYQQQIAEDRLIEREQFQTTLLSNQEHTRNVQSQADDLKKANQLLTQESSQLKEKLDDTAQQLAKEKQQFSSAALELKATQTENEQWQQRFEDKSNQSEQLKEKLATKEDQITSYTQQIATYTQKITMLETSNRLQEQQIQTVYERANQYERQKDQLIKENAELTVKVTTLEQKPNTD